jgi:NAD(P)H dehydrogenase (quinone)
VQSPAEGRFGDYDKPETLLKAYEKLDRLLIIPTAELRPGVRGTQFKAAIEAGKKAGVKNIMIMSAAGTKESPDSSLGGAYWNGEQYLIKNTSYWTILRMNYYAESMADEIKMSLSQPVVAGLGEDRVA